MVLKKLDKNHLMLYNLHYEEIFYIYLWMPDECP